MLRRSAQMVKLFLNIASAIQKKAELQWLALPRYFQLHGPMKSYDVQPIVLDRILGAKLNHLHVLFLLRLALVRRMSEPDPEINKVAADMLNLVIEAVMLKDSLVNSGTSLVWKVSVRFTGFLTKVLTSAAKGCLLRSGRSRSNLPLASSNIISFRDRGIGNAKSSSGLVRFGCRG